MEVDSLHCTGVPGLALTEPLICADDLTQNSTSGATQLFDGLITITDPQLFSDGSAKIRNTAVGGAITATGISYSPCVAVSGPAGDWQQLCSVTVDQYLMTFVQEAGSA